MRKQALAFVLATTFATGSFAQMADQAHAHCEVPCGIYGDSTRIDILVEHVATIRKAMTQVKKLSGEKTPNVNQLVRWTTTKEDHAKKIQHITTQYFLTQRVKSTHKHYQKLLTICHGLLVQAMKSKQTIDTKHADNLDKLIMELKNTYFSKDQLKHMKSH